MDQRTRARFSENQSAPKLENRSTSPCSPRAPNLLHMLPSRMVGWHNLWSPVRRSTNVSVKKISKPNINEILKCRIVRQIATTQYLKRYILLQELLLVLKLLSTRASCIHIPGNAGDGDVAQKEIEQDLLQLITGPALLK